MPTGSLRRLDFSGDKKTVHVFHTTLGWIGCVWENEELAHLTFGQATRAAALEALGEKTSDQESALTPTQRECVEHLQHYVETGVDELAKISISDSHLTPFQRRVVQHCRRIPAGQTLSYGALAAKAGSPGAARAVGNIMATNRVPLVVPCHRVLGSCGALGGYSAPQGLEMKRRLLKLEGATYRAEPAARRPASAHRKNS